MEHESDDNTNSNWHARNSYQRIGTGTGRLRNKRATGNHPNCSINEIGQNIEKSLKLEEICCHPNSSEKPSDNAGAKNSQKSEMIIIDLQISNYEEQTEYIQNQIDKIRDSVEDRQSRIAWQKINEVSRRKSTAKAKRKVANQQERIKLWKQHFETLLGNPPKVIH